MRNIVRGNTKRIAKKLIAMVMAVCIGVGVLPLDAFAMESQEDSFKTQEEESVSDNNLESWDDSITNESDEDEIDTTVSGNTLALSIPNAVKSGDDSIVSRIEWLKDLTTVFDMSVEQDNYPDNYYSDIDSSYEDYYTVMLATEFGLVDVAAGEAFEPEQPTTREYAAHTLNLCIGYSIDVADCSFSEENEVSYPEDIKIAIKKNWINLQNGNFYPQKAITNSERSVMIEAAKEAVDATAIDPDYEGSYQFADNVIVLPKTVNAVLTADNELTLSNCETELKNGDIFGIDSEGFPIVYKAIKVTKQEETIVVETERVDTKNAFKNIDIQGNIDVDLVDVKGFDDAVELKYIVGGTEEAQYEDGKKYESEEKIGEQEVSAVEIARSYDIPDAVRSAYDIGEGVKATIVCKVSKVTPKFKANKDGIYVDVSAKVTFSCNVSMDVLKDLGIVPSYDLAYVPVGYLGYMKLSLDMSLEGKITLSTSIKIGAGIYYEYEKGFRTVTSFKKEAFTIQAKGSASAGIKFSIGLNCGMLEGVVYGKTGGRAEAKSETFTDGKKPLTCMHVGAWLYASIGMKVEAKLLISSAEWSEEKVFFDESNSPVRVYYHYEDGVPVSRCTRDGKDEDGNEDEKFVKYNYYTPADSRYGYNGSGTGIDSEGNEYSVFDYTVNSNGNATITGYKGNVSALAIPDEIDGNPVVQIGKKAFAENTQLIVVAIPDGVVKINEGAFANCKNLMDVTLPSTLKEMGAHAFYNCDSLESIEIPKSLTRTYTAYLSEYAYDYQYGPFYDCDNLKSVTFEEGTTAVVEGLFAHCSGLTEITLPSSITVIEKNAFQQCSNLTTVKFSQNINTIGVEAFSNCQKLTNVKLPSHLQTLGYFAFENCDSIYEIEIPKAMQSVSTTSVWLGGGPNYRDGGPFTFCDNLKKVTFEEGTKSVPANIFTWCVGIREIEIPKNVTTISRSAFANCYNVESAKIPDTVTYIGQEAFSNCYKMGSIMLPKNLQTLGDAAFYNCDGLIEIQIPKTLTTFTSNSYTYKGIFGACDNLKTITFESGIKKIPNYLLYGCTSIEKLEIPEGVTAIGNSALYSCKALVEINLPNSLEEIGDGAFQFCSSMTTLEIPQSVMKIGTDAFANCKNLKEIEIPEKIESISYEMFYKCTKLQKVNLPEKLNGIGVRAFCGCTALENINIPSSVKYISASAFAGSGLVEIVFPEELNIIGSNAFEECNSLEKIEFGNKIKTLGDLCFKGCSKLTSIIIPSSITKIGTGCFMYCELLEQVQYGSGLSEVPNNTFYECTSLTKIDLLYGINKIGNNAFANCTQLSEISIPKTTTTIASNAFSYPDQLTIYGIAGSYAESYADSIGATFVNQIVPATKVSLEEDTVTINVGQETQLIFTVDPINYTDDVIWKSSDESIVSVSEKGVIKAKEQGEAIVQVIIGQKKALCEVIVRQPVTRVDINVNNITLEGGETYTLNAVANPKDAYNRELEWKSSDEKVATVNDKGVVNAVSRGQAEITANATDGSGKYASCKVTVNSTVINVTDITKFASEHPYENNCSDSWIYTKQGASKLEVIFSKETEVEDKFDFLYIYDQDGKEVGKYTGTQLAGQSITVNGNTVKVKLVSDGQGTAYGFSVTKISEITESVEEKFTDVQQGAWYVSAVQYAYDNGIMGGKSETVFAPEANLTRAEFATVLYSQSGKPAVTYRPVFKDVEKGAWYSNPVLWAYDNSIVSGYANGNFGTSDNITREQLALMMYKYAKTKGYDTTAESGMLQKFSDEAQISTWAREAIQWAASHGIMSGKGNGADGKPLLDPQGNATRAECAAMMKKMLTMN